jgi:hypothetical protein
VQTASVDSNVHTLPTGRAFFADQRGVVLRATWHLDRGFLNLSIWDGAACVATFQLQIRDVPRLVSFLADGLGTAAGEALEWGRARLAAAPPPPTTATTTGDTPTAPVTAALNTVADRVRDTWRSFRPR